MIQVEAKPGLAVAPGLFTPPPNPGPASAAADSALLAPILSQPLFLYVNPSHTGKASLPVFLIHLHFTHQHVLGKHPVTSEFYELRL